MSWSGIFTLAAELDMVTNKASDTTLHTMRRFMPGVKRPVQVPVDSARRTVTIPILYATESNELGSRLSETATLSWEKACATHNAPHMRGAVKFVQEPYVDEVRGRPGAIVQPIPTTLLDHNGIPIQTNQHQIELTDCEDGSDAAYVRKQIQYPDEADSLQEISEAWTDRLFKQLNELLDLQAKDVEIGTAQLALSGISLWLQKIEVKIGLATLLVTALALALTVGAIPNPFQKPALSTPSVAISRMVKYAGLRAIEQKMVAAETVLVGDTLNAYSGASAGDHNDELFIVQGGDVTRAEGGIVDSVVPERPGMMHVISIRTREPMTAPQLGLMEIAFSELSIARPLESGLHAVWDATDVNYQWVTGRDGTEPEPNSTFTEAAVEFLTRLNDAFGEGNWSLAGRSFPVLPTEHSAAQSTAAVVAAEQPGPSESSP